MKLYRCHYILLPFIFSNRLMRLALKVALEQIMRQLNYSLLWVQIPYKSHIVIGQQ